MRAERILDELVRGVPPRRAPAALELRVYRELQRRAALPWWFRVFSQWPAAARTTFVVLCSVVVLLSVSDGTWNVLARAWSLAVAAPLSWTHPGNAILGSACAVGELLRRLVPWTWIYRSLIAGMALYAALFGLLAAAYRALCWEPLRTGERP